MRRHLRLRRRSRRADTPTAPVPSDAPADRAPEGTPVEDPSVADTPFGDSAVDGTTPAEPLPAVETLADDDLAAIGGLAWLDGWASDPKPSAATVAASTDPASTLDAADETPASTPDTAAVSPGAAGGARRARPVADDADRATVAPGTDQGAPAGVAAAAEAAAGDVLFEQTVSRPWRAVRAVGWVGRRCLKHKWLRAGLVAGALVLPGSMLAEAAGVMSGGSGRSPATQLGGMLPTQNADPALEPFLDEEMLAAVPVGAGPVAEPVEMVLTSSRVIDTLGQSGIPRVAVDAYMQAADRTARTDPSCGIRWTLLAAIGRVESNHGRFGDAQLRDDGYGTKPIRGIPLDGRRNVALIRDTDGGALDGDTTFDRAVGPMQFIPSTWASVGVDANGDGDRDPNNIFDAAQGAAAYLCSGGGDLRVRDDQARAVRTYNNAAEYVDLVLRLAAMYESGDVETLPAIGLPPREPTPPPRPTPEPPRSGAPARSSSAGPPVGGGSGARPSAPSGPAAGGGAPTRPSAPTPTPPAPSPDDGRPLPGPGAPVTPRPPTSMPTRPPRTTTTTTPSDPSPTSTSTTVPDPSTTTTTAPPVATPTTTVPEEPPAAPEPPDTAAVGWAPAMRQVVVEILEQGPPPPPPPCPPADPAAPTTTAPPPAGPPACTPAEPPGPAADPASTAAASP